MGDPPSFLQLAGHPMRWRLLGELARSDRRVHELTAIVGEPQNLVSYHLGKLRDAGLVSAHRSSADRRDAYYAVDLDRVRRMLADTGAALHPALHLTAPAPDLGRLSGARVLFLCTGNSARSQIAEALAVARSRGALEARSAGSHPKPLHPNAVRVLRDEHRIDISGRRPTHLDELAGEPFDRVVTLCDRVREVCPERPHTEAVHWSIPDPAAGHDGDDDASYPAFCQVAAELDARIGFLLADLADRVDPIPA